MTTPITDHDAGDESDFKFQEIVGLSGAETVVPSTGSWMQQQIAELPAAEREELQQEATKLIQERFDILARFCAKSPQHREGAD